jgi:hypothetical protein
VPRPLTEGTLSSQVRQVVRCALEAVNATEAEIKNALKKASVIYDARSRLVHEGDLPLQTFHVPTDSHSHLCNGS